MVLMLRRAFSDPVTATQNQTYIQATQHEHYDLRRADSHHPPLSLDAVRAAHLIIGSSAFMILALSKALAASSLEGI